MTGSPVLSCRDLEFFYGSDQVLHKINLDVYAGEFVAILGRNGAGKSTLLSCLSRTVQADFSVLAMGELNLACASRREIARKLSYVPQEHDKLLAYTVLDVVVMGRTAYLGVLGIPQEEDYLQAEAVLEELGIKALKNRAYPTLSGGEKQMVLLARALLQTRNLMFLDEPTNHLDYKNRYQMLSRLKELTTRCGTAILTCLHDPNHALAFADRAILMQDGHIIADGKTEEVLTSEVVGNLYEMPVIKSACGERSMIHPACIEKEFSNRVALVTGFSGSGKTSLLEKSVRMHPEFSFGGILCPGTFRNGLRQTQTIHCLTSGDSEAFSRRIERNQTSSIPFHFEQAGVDLARRALQPEVLHDVDCIMIDEVGPLELEGKGHAISLPTLLSLQNPRHIWVVRPEIVSAVCRHFMLGNPTIIEVEKSDAEKKMHAFLTGALDQ